MKVLQRKSSLFLALGTGILCVAYYGIGARAWTKSIDSMSVMSNRNGIHVSSAMKKRQNHVMSIPRGGADDEDQDSSATNDSGSSSNGFEIVDEKLAYSGWRTIIQRKVRMRNGKIVDFDLVGVKTGEGAVLVFAWDPKSKTATMVREYMPATNRVMWGLAAGLIEDKHGQDTETAARHELEEECHLKGGKWIPLLTQPVVMDKYALTTIQCYLVIDPEPETNPKPLDDEEDIEIKSGVTVPEIMSFIQDGDMNLVGAFGSLLAIEKLRELGEYP